jgi:hypothetical protein
MAIEIQVGDIVKTKDYLLLLFPTQKTAWAAGARATAAGGGAAAAEVADYWSKTLGCSVSCVEIDQPLFAVEVCGAFIRVLVPGDKSGWIVNVDWLGLEIVQGL